MVVVATLCVQYEADFRPNMSIVVKALQPLLTARPGPASETPKMCAFSFSFSISVFATLDLGQFSGKILFTPIHFPYKFLENNFN